MSSPVRVFEVPVEMGEDDLMRAYEIQVSTERGDWIEVNVLRNLVRDSYEIEFSAALLELNPHGLTATIQQVFLALAERSQSGRTEVAP